MSPVVRAGPGLEGVAADLAELILRLRAGWVDPLRGLESLAACPQLWGPLRAAVARGHRLEAPVRILRAEVLAAASARRQVRGLRRLVAGRFAGGATLILLARILIKALGGGLEGGSDPSTDPATVAVLETWMPVCGGAGGAMVLARLLARVPECWFWRNAPVPEGLEWVRSLFGGATGAGGVAGTIAGIGRQGARLGVCAQEASLGWLAAHGEARRQAFDAAKERFEEWLPLYELVGLGLLATGLLSGPLLFALGMG